MLQGEGGGGLLPMLQGQGGGGGLLPMLQGQGGGGEEGRKRGGEEVEATGQRRKKVKFDDGYRSSQDKDGSGEVTAREELELEEKVEEEEEEEEEGELVEVFPAEGVAATVEKFLNHRIVVVTVTHPETQAKVPVLVNITEVWVGEMPFLETRSSWTLKQVLEGEEGKALRLNAREVANSHCEIGLQATAVWTSEHPPPYHSPLLRHSLDLHLRRHLFFKTGRSDLRTNPLAGETSAVVRGVVVEYLSGDLGLAKLEGGEGDVAIFHLSQVWRRVGGRLVPYRGEQGEALELLLPLGATVLLSYRRLPAHNMSALRCQATVLWKATEEEEEEEEGTVPMEHLNRHATQEERVALMQELDHHHDTIKSLLNLHLPPTDPRFRPVQTILNGLPSDWQAEVVAGISPEFGIIQICHVDGLEFAIGPGVKFLYAMFHLDDVWDRSGVKDPTVAMAALVGSCVDLTARPICAEAEPDKVFEAQRKLMEEKLSYGEIPLLQAVIVCVKRFPYDEVNVTRLPQPTVLREGPGSFGLDITEFYLDPTLGHRLDRKLQRFLNIPNNLQFLYERVMRKIDMMEERAIKAELAKVDSARSGRWSHGELPGRAARLPPYMTMPRNIGPIKSLKDQLVRPVFLHTRNFKADCGVVELIINNSGQPQRTLAFFEMSQVVSFKPVNMIVTDLRSMIKMPECRETFHGHMELVFPDSPIPYVCLNIWNEDSRKMFGRPVPAPALDQEQPFYNPQQSRSYYESCRETVQEIVRSGPAPPRPPPIGKGRRSRGGRQEVPKVPALPFPSVAPSPWQDVATNFYGVVLRVVNKNYALAAGILTNGKEDAACIPFQLLFDSCDLFLGERSCAEKGRSLVDEVDVGHFVRFHAVRVEMERPQPSRNLRYMATAVVAAKTPDAIQKLELPENAPQITLLEQLADTKVANFKAIANMLNSVKLDEREQEIFHKLESGELNEVKTMKKGFTGADKEKQAEEDDVLIKKFREQHPFTEDKTEDSNAEDDENKGSAFGWSNKAKDATPGKSGLTKQQRMEQKQKPAFIEDVPVPVDEEILAAEKALKDKALERMKAKAEEAKQKKADAKQRRLEAFAKLDAKKQEADKAKEMQLDQTPDSEKESTSQPEKRKEDTPQPELKQSEKPKPTEKPQSSEGFDMAKICEELTPKQMRKLVMAYMDVVSKLPEKNPRNKIDPQAVAKIANLEKDSTFLERFFLAFGQECQAASKGVKVGSVFVTQTQVRAVLAKGILGREHLLKEGEQAAAADQTGDVFSDFAPADLRRLVLSFLKLMERSKRWPEVATEHGLPVERVQGLLVALTERCREVAKGDVRELAPFKLHNIFISKDWAKRIFLFNYTGEPPEEEIEEITLDSD